LKKQLELFVDDVRLKLTDANAHREPTTDAAESVRQHLSSCRDLLTAVECRQTDLQRLQEISVILRETASEARQTILCSEVAALTDAIVELMETLMQRVSQLEVLDRCWTELGTQSNELRTLLHEKQETLQQTMHDSSRTPDQQYAVVKVRVIFCWYL